MTSCPLSVGGPEQGLARRWAVRRNSTIASFALGHHCGHGFPNAGGGNFAVTELPVAEALADLDDIAGSTGNSRSWCTPPFTDLLQSFGAAVLAQITDDGRIRTAY